MRAFIAIDPDIKTEKHIESLKGSLPTGVRPAKGCHLTLKFLGNIQNVDEVIEALHKIEFKPLKLKLAEIGYFPSSKYIMVVWVGLEENNMLYSLQQDIDSVLNSKSKKFHPHITLGRVKYIQDKKKFLDDLKNIIIKPLQFTVDKFVLYKSTLTPGGPIYEVVEEFVS